MKGVATLCEKRYGDKMLGFEGDRNLKPRATLR